MRADRRASRQPADSRVPLVTLWAGQRAAVVAVSAPGIAADRIQISLRGCCLKLRGATGGNLLCQDLQLPWPVQSSPVRIDDGSGVFHILLQRKPVRAVSVRGASGPAVVKSIKIDCVAAGGGRRESLVLKSLEGILGMERRAAAFSGSR